MPNTSTVIVMIYLKQESFSVYIKLILMKKSDGNQILHLYPVFSAGNITWGRNFGSLESSENVNYK